MKDLSKVHDPYADEAAAKIVEKIQEKKYKPNYRCVALDTMDPSGCPDFFLKWKEEGCTFVCPKCGSKRLMPLF